MVEIDMSGMKVFAYITHGDGTITITLRNVQCDTVKLTMDTELAMDMAGKILQKG
jgi:hypothetical protein